MCDDLNHRARVLHETSIVFLGHDHFCNAERLLAMQPAGLTAKVTLVATDADVWAGPERMQQSLHEYTGWTQQALAEFERVTRIVEANPDSLCIARSAADIEQAHAGGKSAVVFGFEGGKPIEQSLELLGAFHRLGLRMMQLTWAGGNDICDRRDPPICEGLTDFGREVVREMSRLGILIDPGHCSPKTFWQVLELSEKPIGLLHTAPAGTKPGCGELGDDRIRAIADRRGVIGLHFISHYLHPHRKGTLDDLIDHAAYIADLVGTDCIGLGADFFALTPEFIAGHGVPPSGFLGFPEEFDSYEKLVNVTAAFLRRGFSTDDIARILGGNLLRLFREATEG